MSLILRGIFDKRPYVWGFLSEKENPATILMRLCGVCFVQMNFFMEIEVFGNPYLRRMAAGGSVLSAQMPTMSAYSAPNAGQAPVDMGIGGLPMGMFGMQQPQMPQVGAQGSPQMGMTPPSAPFDVGGQAQMTAPPVDYHWANPQSPSQLAPQQPGGPNFADLMTKMQSMRSGFGGQLPSGMSQDAFPHQQTGIAALMSGFSAPSGQRATNPTPYQMAR